MNVVGKSYSLLLAIAWNCLLPGAYSSKHFGNQIGIVQMLLFFTLGIVYACTDSHLIIFSIVAVWAWSVVTTYYLIEKERNIANL